MFQESNVIDLETLCVIPGEKVYVINCHINVLDNGGNLIDAIGYATFHALKHFRRPFVTVVGNVVKEYLDKERELTFAVELAPRTSVLPTSDIWILRYAARRHGPLVCREQHRGR